MSDNIERGSFYLGTHRGIVVNIGWHRRPAEAPAPDEWGVNLYVPIPHGENMDIARVDTDHAGCHADHLYRDPPKREDYSVFYTGPDEAIRKFFTKEEQWRDYLDKYVENYGRPDQGGNV